MMHFGNALVDFSRLLQWCTASSLHHIMLGDEAYLSGEEHAGLAPFALNDDTHSSIQALSEATSKNPNRSLGVIEMGLAWWMKKAEISADQYFFLPPYALATLANVGESSGYSKPLNVNSPTDR